MPSESHTSSEPVNSSLYVSPERQRGLEKEALSGSAFAAHELAIFHMFYRGDRDRTIYWSTIGAENGSWASAYELYTYLENSPQETDRMRALFWLKKAAAGGYDPAISELRSIDASRINAK